MQPVRDDLHDAEFMVGQEREDQCRDASRDGQPFCERVARAQAKNEGQSDQAQGNRIVDIGVHGSCDETNVHDTLQFCFEGVGNASLSRQERSIVRLRRRG